MGQLPLVLHREELRPLYAVAHDMDELLTTRARTLRDLEVELEAIRKNAARALTAYERGDDKAVRRLLRGRGEQR